MKLLRLRLLSSSVIKLGVGGGIAAGSALALAACSNPYAAPTPTAAAPNQPAVLAQANPCNPCAAKNPCNPCNPCAAANPCNPCAAKGMAGASDCVVPRLQTAAAQNPCAAKNPCSPCAAANPCNPCAATNPCAAKNPCNPCAAANPCNPCAAANPCNPCNPCAPAEAVELTPDEATAAYACVKGVMKAAYTGQMQRAAANPCNPCAAANPCNPCAAIKPANPCNPCAAKNPCKPEAANTTGGPQIIQAAALTDEIAAIARDYQSWQRLNTVPYVSATHGSRYVNNYPGPEAAELYGKFEAVGTMPAGGRIAKDSFTVSPDGRIAVGPLFLMEKMPEGFNEASDDWRYAMIMPDGSLFGVTNGQGSQNVQFCAECHALVADDQDSLYFLPEEFRATSG